MKKKVASFATVLILTSSISTHAFASTYAVQKGDTLESIAKKTNTSIKTIKSLNNLKSNALFYNQTLKISLTASSSGKINPAGKPSSNKSSETYTVVKGDSLSKIATKHKVSLAELKSINNLANDMIYIGQVLKVSNTSSPVSPKEEAKKENTQEQITPTLVNGYYVVKSGDYLAKIAGQFNLTVTQLKLMNNLNSDLIYVGQKLVVSDKSLSNSEQKPNLEETIDNPLINNAIELLGTPYAFGGSTLNAFDCSGFIYYVFNKAGKSINRLSSEGYYDRSYYVDSPQIGDLIFFENTYKPGISHMGIYLGDNKFIHASPTNGVEINDLSHAYYQKHFESYKRFY